MVALQVEDARLQSAIDAAKLQVREAKPYAKRKRELLGQTEGMQANLAANEHKLGIARTEKGGGEAGGILQLAIFETGAASGGTAFFGPCREQQTGAVKHSACGYAS